MFGAAAGGAVAAGLVALTKSSIDAVDHIQDLSDQTGVSTAALTNLEYASKGSGVNIDGVSAALSKMNVNLAKAKEGDNAFSKLGLDAAELKAMKPDEAFSKIADAINMLPTHADRAAAAVSIFGRAGTQLLPVLAAGSEGLAAFAEENRKFGGEVTAEGSAAVQQLDAAMNRLGQVVVGLGRQLAVQLSPFITALIEQFTAWTTSGLNVGEIVTTALEWIAKGVGYVADAWQVMHAAFKFVQSGVTKGLSIILDGLTAIAKGCEWVVEKLTGAKSDFSSTLEAMATDLDKLAQEQGQAAANIWNSADASKKVDRFFNSIRNQAKHTQEEVAKVPQAFEDIADATAEASKEGESLIEDLEKQLATFGMSAREIKRWEIANSDLEDSVKAQANALLDQLDAMEANKKAEQEAIDRAKNGAEQMQEAERPEAKFAGALDFNSAEARSIVLQNRFNNSSSPMNEVAKNSTQQLAEQRLSNTFLKKLAEEKEQLQPFVFAGA